MTHTLNLQLFTEEDNKTLTDYTVNYDWVKAGLNFDEDQRFTVLSQFIEDFMKDNPDVPGAADSCVRDAVGQLLIDLDYHTDTDRQDETTIAQHYTDIIAKAKNSEILFYTILLMEPWRV